MKKTILLFVIMLSATFAHNSFALTNGDKAKFALMATGDGVKCVAALAWSVPTLIGMGVQSAIYAGKDTFDSIIEGELAFSLTKKQNKKHQLLITSLIEIGCLMRIDQIDSDYQVYDPIYKH